MGNRNQRRRAARRRKMQTESRAKNAGFDFDPAAPQNVGHAQQILTAFAGGISGFEGARHSERRGYIYWPHLDNQRELDTYTREELIRKSRWACANFGLARRICYGLADLIGYLTPLAMTEDEEWNELAEDLWQDRAMSPGVIDASGKHGIGELQIHWNRAAFRDGDCLPTFIEGSTGGAMMATYFAPQISQGKDLPESYVDGVKLNKFRRHLAYALRRDYSADSKRQIVPASSTVYHAFYDDFGRVRPPGIMAAALNHIQDIGEILADTKFAIKIAAQIGLYLKEAANSQNVRQRGAALVGGGLRNESLDTGNTAAEGNEEFDVKVEDLYKDAGGVADLPKGVDLGVIQDTRPHPNQIALMEFLIRDISWSAGVASDLLWNIEKLRGANNRLLNADLNRWIGSRQLTQRTRMRRIWSSWISAEMRAGRLREPRAGNFWDVEWLPQASLTADRGREGKLNIELVKHNMRTLATEFGEQGLHWVRQLKQISKEKRKLQELDLALDDLSGA